MGEMVIRPTMKFIYVGYLLVIAIVVASVVVLMHIKWSPSVPLSAQHWIPGCRWSFCSGRSSAICATA